MHDTNTCTESLTKGEEGEGVYVYCFARSDLAPSIEGKGVDGQHPVFLHAFQDIAAAASMISLEEFCGPSAESRMQDLSWVGPRACRHEEVVEEVMRYSPVMPARFGTIFSSLERLDEALRKHRDAMSRFLGWVADKDEWGVRALLDRAKAKMELFSAAVVVHEERLSLFPPGTRYFEEQRIRTGAEKELAAWLKAVCRKVGDDLTSRASQCRERKVACRDGTAAETVVNWAFLVPRNVAGDFRARVDRANEEHHGRGLVFEATGPWPPYSFCPCLEEEER
jgi:hypothetical protein